MNFFFYSFYLKNFKVGFFKGKKLFFKISVDLIIIV